MNLRSLTMLTIVWVVASPAAQAASLPVGLRDIDVVRAMDAFDSGHEAVALELVQGVVDHPELGDVWVRGRFVAARAALATGAPQQALHYLDGLDEPLQDVQDFVWALRARAYRAMGKWQQARAVWTQLIASYPDSPLVAEAQFGVADADFAAGDLNDAAHEYETAIRAAPRSDAAYFARFNLGQIAASQHRWRYAASVYRYFAYRRPSDPLNAVANARLQSLVARGLTPEPSFYTRLHRVDRLLAARSIDEAKAAVQALTADATTSSRQRALTYRQAQLAYRQHDFERAIELFNGLVAATLSRRHRLEYEQWVARSYSSADNAPAAIKVYLDIATRARRSHDARDALFKAAWLAYNGGSYSRAVALFSKFIGAYPTDRNTPDAMWYLAWNAYHLGDLPTALQTLTDLRQRFPDSTLVQRAWYWQGRIAMLMGSVRTAQQAFRGCSDVDPMSYYGALSQQRMRELEDIVTPAGMDQKSMLLASTIDPELPGDPGSLQPSRDELPPSGGLRPLRKTMLPWGATVFDWTSTDGKRAIALMKLGLVSAAARIVDGMQPLPGHDNDEVAYARARLLYSLGDFNGAYRIVEVAFADRLKERPVGKARRYYRIAYPDAYTDLVLPAAHEFSISPLLILAVMRQESAYDDGARSWASANGLMQIIPRTGKRIAAALQVSSYNYSVLRDPAVNVRFGAYYLAQLLRKFHGNVALAVGGYNAGPVAMSRWVDMRADAPSDEFVEDIPYRETRDYVRRVLGNLAVYRAIYGRRPFALKDRVPATYLAEPSF